MIELYDNKDKECAVKGEEEHFYEEDKATGDRIPR